MHWKILTFGMQIYLQVEHKCGLAGIEEMNNVIVEKHLGNIYF